MIAILWIKWLRKSWLFHRKPDGSTSMENFAGYLQWEEWFEEQKELEALQLKAEAKKEKASGKPAKLSFKEKFELENMEATLHELEAKLTAAQAQSQKPEVVSQASKSRNFIHRSRSCNQKLKNSMPVGRS